MLKKNSHGFVHKVLIFISVCTIAVSAQKAVHARYGFDALSLNGAGRAIDMENSATWANPAAIANAHTDSYESGFAGFGVEPSYYLSWLKSISDNSALSLSYSVDPLVDFEVHSLAMSVALLPLRKVSVGFSAFGRTNEDSQISMDFSSGIQYRYNKNLSTAFDVRSIFESLDSTQSQPYTKRIYGAGVGYAIGTTRSFIVADIQSASPYFKSPLYTLGVGVRAGSNNNLKVLSGINLFKEHSLYTSRLSLGLKMQERFFGMLINAHYAIENITLQGDNSKLLSHAVGFGLILDAFIDKTPPVVAVRLDKSILLLSTQSVEQSALYFQLQSEDSESNLKLWHLILCSVNEDFTPKDVVKSFSGKGIPPKTIRWEGRGTDNERLAQGIYTYRFIVADEANNVNKTLWQLLEIQ